MSEENIALYRKYRPQTFADVLDQEHIVTVLQGAVNDEKIAHAYLFAGSRGTGKTSIARILAREIGCTEKDLYEIDAASNRGIDDIRELRESVQTVPFESPYKVYIIDEVHMLTKEAFNALLKTLEEPPKHVVFVLATTEADRLPDTVRSRCQAFSFKKPTQHVLAQMVTRVAKKEGFELELAAAELIALLGDGSYRDTHGVLQKVLTSSSNKKIDVAQVEHVTDAPSGCLINDVLSALAGGDLSKGIQAVHTAAESNVDMKLFLKLLLQKLRSVMLLRYAPDLEPTIKEQYGDADFVLLHGFAGNKNALNSKVLSELLTAYDQIGTAHIPQLPIELALIHIVGEPPNEVI